MDWTGWMDTPLTAMTTRASAVLKNCKISREVHPFINILYVLKGYLQLFWFGGRAMHKPLLSVHV